MDAIIHFLGLCPDSGSHPSLLCLLGLTPFFLLIKDSVKSFFSFINLGVKTLLKQKN